MASTRFEPPTVRGPGRSAPQIEAVERDLARLAPSRLPVLLTGETGVGKDRLAQTLHRLSGRPGRWLPVDLAALPPALIGSELFGHSEGAFTGADTARCGAFVAADLGTLYLDEIDRLPAAAQAALLRVVEQGEICPLGSHAAVSVDVRVIASTRSELRHLVAAGTFRADLYHRLAVATIRVPPLRDRRDDIPRLAAQIAAMADPPRRISPAAMRVLLVHRWPGNVRELLNTIERACILTDAIELKPTHLVLSSSTDRSRSPSPATVRTTAEVYDAVGRSASLAARVLGVDRATIYRRLRRPERSVDQPHRCPSG